MAISPRIDELKRKFDENPRRYFAPLANEYRKAGDLDLAIELCRMHLPQQPAHMSGHIVFGQALFEAGKLDEAQSVFETALSLDPENLIALRHMGDIARRRGQHEDALRWYRRVMEADPRNEEIAAVLRELEKTAPPAAPAAAQTGAGQQHDGSGSWADVHPEGRSSDQDASDAAGQTLRIEHPEAEVGPSSVSLDDGIERSTEVDFTARPAGEASPVEEEDIPLISRGSEDAFPDLTPPPGTSPAPPTAFEPRPPREDFGLESTEFVPPAGGTNAPVQGLAGPYEYIEPPKPSDPARTTQPMQKAQEAQPMQKAQEAQPAAPAEPEVRRSAFVTETMAELYLQQGFKEEALSVYRQLLAQNPGDAALRQRVEHLEQGGRSSMAVAEVSDEVVDRATQRHSFAQRRTVRAFFSSLAGRRVVGPGEGNGPYVPTRGEPASPPEDASRAASAASAGPAAEPHRVHVPSATEGLPFVYEPPPAAAAPPAPEPAVERRAVPPGEDHLNVLFNGKAVSPVDEHAARSLADAFPLAAVEQPDPSRGRPTRAASSELSLDHVFRDHGQKSQGGRRGSEFSFDQFFSGDASQSDVATAQGTAHEEEAGAHHSDDEELEQFNTWLDSLKKK